MREQSADAWDPDALSVALAQMYPQRPDKALAIQLGGEALSHVFGSADPERWSVPSPAEGVALTPEAVFSAAAEVPLVLLRDQLRFDAEELHQRAAELVVWAGDGLP